MNNKKLSLRHNRTRIFWLIFLILSGWAILLLVVLYLNFYTGNKIGPEQPIPFSHRVHAHKKQISCIMCHQTVTSEAVAGIPALQTCMLCHSRIIINYPPIRDLRQHYFQGKPVFWKKVTYMPDFVFYNHSVHIHRGIDCGKCHGNVREMDRIYLYQDLQMGFCVQCHRENNVIIDCFTCHR